MTSWKFIGNLAHCINIVLVFCHGLSVLVLQDSGRILDGRWLEEGFCKPENTSVEQMHLDSGLALALISFPFIVYLYRASRRDMHKYYDDGHEYSEMSAVNNYVNNAMVGVIGHALGHFIIFESIRVGMYPQADLTGMDDLKNDSIGLILRKILPGYIFFWTPLIKSYMQHASWVLVLLFAQVALLGSLHVQLKFGFAFAQCFFFFGLSLDQLLCVSAEKKTFAFALYPLITVLPSIIFSLAEATACSSLPLLKAYGHIVYDTYMGFSYILYYGICQKYVYHNKLKHEKVKEE
mmetsp:Transcript_14261/g.21420  ORF Transcript_14261/g.21420 Transcript_14261/m.21420 type:complete len:293 (+) Transcript_14261:126-1004(+)